MKARPYELRGDQRGFASIIIAFVLILVLSLITVGFAQLMRHEQRAALDKQLNSQAYYAAESGINQAVAAVNAGYSKAKTSCDNSTVDTTLPGSSYLMGNKVGTPTGATYPCLLVNPMPPNLQYSSIDTTSTKVIELDAVDSSGISSVPVNTVEISWQDSNGGTSFASSCNTFYPATGGSPNWTYTGLLRAELIPLNNSGGANGLDRSDLINNAYTAFLCPDTSNPNLSLENYVTNKGNSSGVILNGKCSSGATPRYCNAFITNLSGLKEVTFFLTLRSIYSPTTTTITVCSIDCKSNDILNISGAQVLIDSTGKAQDILRRIQVRVPVHNNYDIPNGTGAMQSLCKQLQLTPGGGINNGGPGCAIP